MNQKIEAKLAALKQHYAKNLPNKISEIQHLWSKLGQNFSKAVFEEFYRAVHSLVGSAGTYDFMELSQTCRDLEVYLQQLLSYDSLNELQKNEISHLLECVNECSIKKKRNETSANDLSKPITSRLIYYLIEKKEKFQEELHANLEHLGYELILLPSADAFAQHFAQKIPAAIAMDELYLNHPSFITMVQTRPQQVPLLCLAISDDLYIRLKAIRAGVSFYIQKPVELFHLTNQLTYLCDLSVREDYRVLILDDSESLGNYYCTVLEGAGMKVSAITSPHQLMHELLDFKPNLLLLDLYLPECNGFDIAKIIRQEESYVSLPIIFISTEDNRAKQLSILNNCGGDDFLTKPVLPQNLIAAVKSRAQRSALLNSYIALDSLTKLLNHTYILKQLSFEILRAERLAQSISIAMIDIDYFKQINDKYGHPVGDLVLKKLSELLLSRVRKTDFVGRYGGEEFVIIFPDTPEKRAYKLCVELCDKVGEYPFKINNHTFYITLSIGIAQYPTFLSADGLVAAADSALYRAKADGRNRVEIKVV